MKNKKNGFTLIELIVSVTIIAVLTVVGVISYSGTNKKARDSRRMADLEKIRIALELYRQENNGYPLILDGLLTPKYIQTIPVDPKGTTYGYYEYALKTTYTYDLKANVEDLGSTNMSAQSGHCGNVCDYKVTQP